MADLRNTHSTGPPPPPLSGQASIFKLAFVALASWKYLMPGRLAAASPLRRDVEVQRVGQVGAIRGAEGLALESISYARTTEGHHWTKKRCPYHRESALRRLPTSGRSGQRAWCYGVQASGH